ncbi:MAG: DUF4293 domain-containing protein [Prevotella sp.]
MIQRKQTVFLILAIVASVVCLMLPIGHFVPNGMGTDSTLFNLCISYNGISADREFTPLFFIMLVTFPVSVLTIFKFHDRVLQARLCVVNIVLMILWYADYLAYAFWLNPEGTTFKPAFAACLPLVTIILYLLARAGIIADEKLVRAADRIR